ncbi:helix-turn-helix domain-containing protein [Streptomyces sp. NPDC001586]|uniref:helix-turn-helix domain-containing protein n=1 Tax=Streptomyces sp. NPDC001586 TaxID=3154387 RepID=UPI003321AFF2
MARRENPVAPCGKSLLALVTWLRAGRASAGLTYQQLAVRTPFSADTLARAASGRSVPQNLSVVVAYARACGRNVKEAERLWKNARRDEVRAQGVLAGHRGGGHITVAKDFADLHSAIVDLYQDDGCPPLRSLDGRAGGVGRLPHSTAGRILNGQSTPSRAFVLAFAEACGVRKGDLPEWGKAWDRADADLHSTRMRRRRPRVGHPGGFLTAHDRVTPRDLQLLMSDLESSARKEPGLKLLVAVPDPGAANVSRSARRMTRELLVDQAQRRGELACPRCRRPSFAYDGATGWTRALCGDCTSEQAGSPSPGPEPQGAPTRQDPNAFVAAPPLPQRTPGTSWPRPAETAPAAPVAEDPFSAPPPAPPAPQEPGRRTSGWIPHPNCHCTACELTRAGPPEGAATPPMTTTRIRIDIPGAERS